MEWGVMERHVMQRSPRRGSRTRVCGTGMGWGVMCNVVLRTCVPNVCSERVFECVFDDVFDYVRIRRTVGGAPRSSWLLEVTHDDAR